MTRNAACNWWILVAGAVAATGCSSSSDTSHAAAPDSGGSVTRDAGDTGKSRDAALGTHDAPVAPSDARSLADGGLPAYDAAEDVGTLVDGAAGGSHDAAHDTGLSCPMGPPSATTAPATVDLSCFASTFDDSFNTYDISSGPVADGKYPNERWFNGTDQCCMSPSNGWPGVMYPTAGQVSGQPVNPYSLMPGGGLQISLQESNNEWFSGVMTSVDQNGNGFAQAYGYFEMETQLPPGTGTWPSFWMLSLPMGQAGGEIDVFEQLGCSPPLNPAVEEIFHFTLHDWAGGTTPAAYETNELVDLTAGYHRYGLLWNSTYMALYFDGALLFTTPTPSVMIDTKYYLLADLGIGSGWVTTSTPNPSNMLIKSIRAYTVPGF